MYEKSERLRTKMEIIDKEKHGKRSETEIDSEIEKEERN